MSRPTCPCFPLQRRQGGGVLCADMSMMPTNPPSATRNRRRLPRAAMRIKRWMHGTAPCCQASGNELIAAPFMQYRWPVWLRSVGKRHDRDDRRSEHNGLRPLTMKKLRSTTFQPRSQVRPEHLGQPVPLSYFVRRSKAGFTTAQMNVPRRVHDSSGLLNARSV